MRMRKGGEGKGREGDWDRGRRQNGVPWCSWSSWVRYRGENRWSSWGRNRGENK